MVVIPIVMMLMVVVRMFVMLSHGFVLALERVQAASSARSVRS